MITGTAVRENMTLPEEVIVRQKLPPPGEVTGLGMKGLQIHLK